MDPVIAERVAQARGVTVTRSGGSRNRIIATFSCIAIGWNGLRCILPHIGRLSTRSPSTQMGLRRRVQERARS
jgi:hypothetical protein